MFSNLFKPRAPVPSRADKMSSAMSQLDTQIANHEESAALQSQMAGAHRERARAILHNGGDRKVAARQLRRAAGCDAQVQHIEAVIASTAGQRQALELSAVHTASATAAEITRSALSEQPVHPEDLGDALDSVSELVSAVQATQDTIAGFADGQVYEEDDELIEALLTADLGKVPARAPPAAPAILLPSVPTDAPAARAVEAGVHSMLDFAPA